MIKTMMVSTGETLKDQAWLRRARGKNLIFCLFRILKNIEYIKIVWAGFFLSFCLLQAQAVTPDERQAAQKIADHFSQLRTMTGDFVQIGPRGERAEGTFYLERPGKIRFTYDNSPIRVISDGKSVVINNKKLDTWDLYQLKQTPMKVLLDDPIRLKEKELVSYQQGGGVISITVANNSLGGGQIRLTFDETSLDLLQWVLIDQQNLETTVQVKSMRSGVRFADGMFKIDYQRIAMRRKK